MQRLIQRIQSYFINPLVAQERVDDLLIELRHRGLNFDIRLVEEEGQRYFYAQSVNYHRGHITATGSTMEELENELKDAIFTAFSIPSSYCISSLIVFNPPITRQTANTDKQVYATT